MKKWSFRVTAILALILSLSVLAGCSGDKGGTLKEKKITLIYTFSTNTLDPAVDKRYMALRSGILETLVRVDNASMKLTPWLASSWQTTDGSHWEFTIRDGVKFHDGSPLDAQAVKISLEKLTAANKGLKNNLKIASMEAQGQKLLIVTTENHPGLASELAHPQTAIIKAAAPSPDTKPIGTGPYMVEKFQPNAQIDLVKNHQYWDGKVNLDKVAFMTNEDANARLMALQSGDADIIMKPASESLKTISANPKLQVDAVKGISRVHNVIYNCKRPLMVDASFRKGLDALINRQEIVNTVLMGQADAAQGPFVKEYPFAPDYSAHAFGLEKALEYFKEGGYPVVNNQVLGKDGNHLKLKFISYTAQPEFPAITQMIQDNAKKLGIQLTIQLVDNIDDYLIANEDWDLSMYSVFAVPRGDARYYLNTFIAPGAAYNYARITNPQLGGIIQKYNVELDEKQRNELTRQATEIIDKENYISYILFPKITSAYNKRVTGWSTDPLEYYVITKNLDVSAP